MEDVRVIAVIPARGGSKGIPGKNVKMFAGKPLLQHSIEQALRSKYIQRVIVSTDSQDIMKLAKNCKLFLNILIFIVN